MPGAEVQARGFPCYPCRRARAASPRRRTEPTIPPPIPASSSRRLPALGACFVLTGANALLVEQSFEKLLTTVVGASTQAAAIVLATTFAGFTFGGLLYGRLTRLRVAPVHLYAGLEAAVGAGALALAAAFTQVQAASAALVRLAGEPGPALVLARVAVSALWIVPLTTAMGATFPAMADTVRVKGDDRARLLVARFYALNLLGAFLGAALGPHLLFARLGITGSLAAVGAAQAAVVAIVLSLSRGVGPPDTPPGAPAGGPGPEGPPAGLRAAPPLLLAVAFASGFTVFACEVTWIHLVGVTVGMSVYAFATVLTAVLLGLLASSAMVSALGRRTPVVSRWVPGAVLVGSGAVLLACHRLWDDAPRWLFERGAGLESFAAGEGLRLGVALVVMFPPAAALGAVFPLLFRLPEFSIGSAGVAAGRLGAANAVGSILGALLAGLWVLPAVGSEATGVLLALLSLGLGLALFASAARHAGGVAALGRVPTALAVALLAAAAVAGRGPAWDRVLLTSGLNVYFRPLHVRPDSRIVYWHEDTTGGITTVVEPGAPSRERTLLTNGKFQGNDTGEVGAQISFALVPLAHARGRDRGLVIGLGTGMSAAVLAAAGMRHVDVAEIAPGMVDAARRGFGHVNQGVLDRPGTRLYLEDGRNHLLRTRDRYDLISMEVSSIWFAGSGNLYSREFYALARDRLAPGGVLQQWVQLHHIAPEEVTSILASVRAAFPSVALFVPAGQGVIVASEAPLRLDEGLLADLAGRREFQPFLRRMEASTGQRLESLVDSRLLGPEEVDRLAVAAERRGIPLNTDGNRFLEYATPRHNLERVPHASRVVDRLLEFVPESERAERRSRIGLTETPGAPLPARPE